MSTRARVRTANPLSSSRYVATAYRVPICVAVIGLSAAAGLSVVYERSLTLSTLAVFAAGVGARWAWLSWTVKRGELRPVLASMPTVSWAWLWLAVSLGTLIALRPWLSGLGTWNGVLAGADLVVCLFGFVRGFSPKLRPIQTIWFCFQFSWIGVAPIYLVSHHVAAWGDSGIWTNVSAVREAFELNLISAVTAAVGFSWPTAKARSRKVNHGIAVDRPRVRWVYLGLAILLFPETVSAVGGIHALFQSRTVTNANLQAAGLSAPTQGFSVVLPGVLAIVAALLFLKQASDRRSAGSPVGRAEGIATVVALVLAFVLNNPWAFRRADVAAALGPLIVMVWRPRSWRSGVIFAGGALLALLIIYPLSKAFSGGSNVGSVGTASFASADFDGFQQFVNTILYVGDLGHTWGSTSLASIFFFVPRAIWHAKSRPASWIVAGHANYSFVDLSMPFQSEMYLEFGVIGMVLVVGAVCWGLSRLDNVWLSAPTSRLAAMVPYASFAVLYLIRGPDGTSAPLFVTASLLLWLGMGRTPALAEPLAAGRDCSDP